MNTFTLSVSEFLKVLQTDPHEHHIQVNLDMTDSVGPGKLVRHMQNPSYAYDGLSPSYAIVYLIALGTSVDL